jgi:hypothetical protein
MEREKYKQIDGKRKRQTDRWKEKKQTDIKIERRIERWKERNTNRQMEREKTNRKM